MNGTPETRNLDHQGLEVLDTAACWELLTSEIVGRVAFIDEGDPVILPISYRVHGHSIVFLTASGAKLHAAMLGRPVAFEIDGWDADAHTGWSVLLRGVADTVHDALDVSELDQLGLKPWADVVERNNWVRIRPDELSGRRIV